MFDFNNPPAGIIAVSDQVEAALKDMPADVKELLVGQYIDETLVDFVEFFTTLSKLLMPVMTPSAQDWFKSQIGDGMRLMAKAALIQNHIIMPHMLKLADDPTAPRSELQLDESKLDALAEYVTSHEEKFTAAFKQLDDFEL